MNSKEILFQGTASNVKHEPLQTSFLFNPPGISLKRYEMNMLCQVAASEGIKHFYQYKHCPDAVVFSSTERKLNAIQDKANIVQMEFDQGVKELYRRLVHKYNLWQADESPESGHLDNQRHMLIDPIEIKEILSKTG